MAEAGVVREQVPMFEEFSHEESEYRKHVWKEAQSSTYSAPTEPSFRGWLEGKPNPVLPEDAARYAKESMPSASGTKLSDMFPGAVVGTTYHIKDASAEPRVSVTDRPSTYPDIDKGNKSSLVVVVGSLFERQLSLANIASSVAFTTNV